MSNGSSSIGSDPPAAGGTRLPNGRLVARRARAELPLVARAPDEGAAVGRHGGGVRIAGGDGNAARGEQGANASRPRLTAANRGGAGAQLPAPVGAPGVDGAR